MIYYEIYNTVNLVNGKNYIGQHKTDSYQDDDYLGSGKILKQAIDKYGENNFKRTILTVCENKEQADFLEKQYIAFYRLGGLAQYNITAGGGGFSANHTIDARMKISKSLIGNKRSLGYKATNETRQKMSQSRSGKLWFNNGKINVRTYVCPSGFINGRLKWK